MRLNFFTALICGAILLSSSLCLASVDERDVAIENVYPGMNVRDLTYFFGYPSHREGEKWIYDRFHVYVRYDTVTRVSTHSHEVYTPAGISCGMSVETLERTYGRPDQIKHDSDSREYKYYSYGGSRKLEFLINHSGIISKIICKLS